MLNTKPGDGFNHLEKYQAFAKFISPENKDFEKWDEIFTAVLADEENSFKTLLSTHGFTDCNVEMLGSGSLLGHAAKHSYDILQYLVEQLHCDTNIRSSTSRDETPLFSARDENIYFLLEHGAEESVYNAEGFTPFTAAVHKGDYEQALMYLREGLSCSSRDAWKNTVLYIAGRTLPPNSMLSYSSEFWSLVFQRCELEQPLRECLNCRCSKGNTLMHALAKLERVDLIRKAYEFGCQTNQINDDGETPQIKEEWLQGVRVKTSADYVDVVKQTSWNNLDAVKQVDAAAFESINDEITLVQRHSNLNTTEELTNLIKEEIEKNSEGVEVIADLQQKETLEAPIERVEGESPYVSPAEPASAESYVEEQKGDNKEEVVPLVEINSEDRVESSEETHREELKYTQSDNEEEDLEHVLDTASSHHEEEGIQEAEGQEIQEGNEVEVLQTVATELAIVPPQKEKEIASLDISQKEEENKAVAQNLELSEALQMLRAQWEVLLQDNDELHKRAGSIISKEHQTMIQQHIQQQQHMQNAIAATEGTINHNDQHIGGASSNGKNGATMEGLPTLHQFYSLSSLSKGVKYIDGKVSSAKYLAILRRVNDVRNKLNMTELKAAKLNTELQVKLQESNAIIEEAQNALYELKMSIGENCVFEKSGNKIKKNVIQALSDFEYDKVKLISEIRSSHLALAEKLKQLEAEIKSKEKFGDNLELVDFEQLKVENQTLSEKIEERNVEMFNIRKHWHSNCQAISHLKQKVVFVRERCYELKEKLSTLDASLATQRSVIEKTKKDTKNVMNAKERLKKQGIMSTSDKLSNDYEKKSLEKIHLEEVIAEEKAKYYKTQQFIQDSNHGGESTIQ